ncbi:hypothetical protein ABZU25_19125 [Micromonospora sp. NPDC005215]|uniref:hypothetical protein n=1 Tax=Micromonospora sp. NPDC005215 TaxID=3157024 RepID=UPI00339E97F9
MTVLDEQDAPPPAGPPPRLLDLGLRLAGAIVVVVAAVLSGVLELLLATVRVGGQLIGVSALLAVGANIVLSWFAYEAVGRRWAVVLPAVPWFALMAVAAIRTSEGDLLLAGDNWVGLAMIVAGAMTFAVMGFRQILAPPSTLGLMTPPR